MSTEASGIASGAGDLCGSRFSYFCREALLLIVSEKSLMTGFPWKAFEMRDKHMSL